jgi:hypothetical protein
VAVGARFGLDGDGLSRTDRLAQLAGNAALFAIGIATQGVLTTKTRRLRIALIRIEHGRLGAHHVLHGQPEGADKVHEGCAFNSLGDAGRK